MKKSYCDICGEPSHMYTPVIEVHEKVRKECDEKALATCSVRFGFKGHTTCFGGPPDLCRKCKRKMIKKLLKTFFPKGS